MSLLSALNRLNTGSFSNTIAKEPPEMALIINSNQKDNDEKHGHEQTSAINVCAQVLIRFRYLKLKISFTVFYNPKEEQLNATDLYQQSVDLFFFSQKN